MRHILSHSSAGVCNCTDELVCSQMVTTRSESTESSRRQEHWGWCVPEQAENVCDKEAQGGLVGK